MTTTTYTTVNGRILSQSKDGVVHHFVSDPLGSVVMVRDNSGNTVYEAEYDPYGNVQSETGTNPSEFGYVGTLGYVKDSAFSLYVRARYLLTNLGRWLTKDPLWPSEPGFVHGFAMPTVAFDPSGAKPPQRGKPGTTPPVKPPIPVPGGGPFPVCEEFTTCDMRFDCCLKMARGEKDECMEMCRDRHGAGCTAFCALIGLKFGATAGAVCAVACYMSFEACGKMCKGGYSSRQRDCIITQKIRLGKLPPWPHVHYNTVEDNYHCPPSSPPVPNPRPWAPPLEP